VRRKLRTSATFTATAVANAASSTDQGVKGERALFSTGKARERDAMDGEAVDLRLADQQALHVETNTLQTSRP